MVSPCDGWQAAPPPSVFLLQSTAHPNAKLWTMFSCLAHIPYAAHKTSPNWALGPDPAAYQTRNLHLELLFPAAQDKPEARACGESKPSKTSATLARSNTTSTQPAQPFSSNPPQQFELKVTLAKNLSNGQNTACANLAKIFICAYFGTCEQLSVF